MVAGVEQIKLMLLAPAEIGLVISQPVSRSVMITRMMEISRGFISDHPVFIFEQHAYAV